ncbi:MAG: hypothetical protein R8F63_02135 [Acidimicrobiales bacterium]|nr:hypothetical protein [Acidimicrobiales bacterium]
MRRFLVFLCILSTAAVGAWALPAGHADTSLDAAAAGGDAPATLDPLEEPRLSASSAARELPPLEAHPIDPVVAPQETAPASEPVVPASDGPQHLSHEVTPAADSDPAPIVTTTTAAPTTTTAAPVVTVAFTAGQAYGSCGENVPYDIFSGAASPGSTITISSPYGSGTTTADGHGHWERTVEFPSAPRGETFSVSVSGLGGSKTFSFTATGGSHG